MASAVGVEYAPVVVLEALVGAYSAVLFGLLTGRPVQRLADLLPMGLIGCLLGQLAAGQLRTPGLLVGDLHLLEATVGAWALLFVAARLGV